MIVNCSFTFGFGKLNLSEIDEGVYMSMGLPRQNSCYGRDVHQVIVLYSILLRTKCVPLRHGVLPRRTCHHRTLQEFAMLNVP